MTKLLEQKDGEIHTANQRVSNNLSVVTHRLRRRIKPWNFSPSALLQVLAVEAEMRELLSEVAREKQGMEAKFQRLSRAFQDLQQDIS